MRPASVIVACGVLAACTQPEAPKQNLQGSWRLEAAHRALEPSNLTLLQFGSTIFGQATIAGLDPVGPGVPSVSVVGSFSSPTALLEIRIDAEAVAHYTATLDRLDHLVGVLAFSGALGSGLDTVSYVRP